MAGEGGVGGADPGVVGEGGAGEGSEERQDAEEDGHDAVWCEEGGSGGADASAGSAGDDESDGGYLLRFGKWDVVAARHGGICLAALRHGRGQASGPRLEATVIGALVRRLAGARRCRRLCHWLRPLPTEHGVMEQ